MKNIKSILLIASIFFVQGCTSSALYNPGYVTNTATPGTPLNGKALILTDQAADIAFLTQSPSSFTGGGSQLNIEIGNMIRQIARIKFEKAFELGADLANDSTRASEYVVIVKPELRGLDYQFSQLENLGFAITPKAKVIVEIQVEVPGGGQKFSQTYDSGLVQGDTYMFSGNPSEQANKALHDALSLVMSNAADDVYEFLKANSDS
jgi:hypothetical protein